MATSMSPTHHANLIPTSSSTQATIPNRLRNRMKQLHGSHGTRRYAYLNIRLETRIKKQ